MSWSKLSKQRNHTSKISDANLRWITAQTEQNKRVQYQLDAKDGFYHVELEESGNLKIPFWTQFGCYKYMRLPFRINFAPEEFESKLHKKRDGLPCVAVIQNDILVIGFGETEDEASS